MAKTEVERWRKAAAEKPALKTYSNRKTDIVKEPFYDNTRGSGLLCEARSGVLRTRTLRAKYTEGLDTTCQNCSHAEETVRHIVLECAELKPTAVVTADAVTGQRDAAAQYPDPDISIRTASDHAVQMEPSRVNTTNSIRPACNGAGLPPPDTTATLGGRRSHKKKKG